MTTSMARGGLGVITLAALWAPSAARADELFAGGPEDPHATIQSALDAAVDGDVVTVRAGTYVEALATRAAGVTLRAQAGAEVIVRTAGRALEVRHPRVLVEHLVFDGEYGASDTIVVEDAGSNLVLRHVEVRHSGRDCIDLRAPTDVLIEDSLVHHCLASTAPDCAADACRMDAHGIVAGAVQRLTLRRTEVHTFSGDAFQVDPGRDPARWNEVRIESCRFWLAPLPAAEGGFAAGVVPGENAVDTKTPDGLAPSELSITDTTAFGFRAGLIGNMAAFNLKENVRVVLDRITVSDSEIAFRLRGAGGRPAGAQVTVRNAVVHDVDTAVRYEDDIEPVLLQNLTLGGAVGQSFQQASAPDGVIDAHNVLILAASLPIEATGPSNLAADASFFADAAAHDYHLAAGAPAIDSGELFDSFATDRDGTTRPQGPSWDVGAYEHCAGAGCAPAADAGPSDRDAGPIATRDGGPTVMRDGGSPLRTDGGIGGGPDDDGGCGCVVPGLGRPAVPASLVVALPAFLVAACRRLVRRSALG